MRWHRRWFRERSAAARSTEQPTATLQLEELEPRWVPSSSSNWSGYAIPTAPAMVSYVSGSWTVPTVKGPGTTYSSSWVGIDGYADGTVEQVGTEADVVNGVAQYSAWYEMYPSATVTIPLTIHAGDRMTASVSYAGTSYTLKIQDLSNSGSQAFSVKLVAPNAQRASAEWITEAPSSSSTVLPLANFAAVTFTNAQTTINGVTGPINDAAWASTIQSIRMVSDVGALEASASALLAGGTSFSVIQAPPGITPPIVVVTPPVQANPGSTDVTISLYASLAPNTNSHSVIMTATLSSLVPAGSKIELLDGGTVVGAGTVKNVNGLDELTFSLVFVENGTFSFYAELVGAGLNQPDKSNTVTITVTAF